MIKLLLTLLLIQLSLSCKVDQDTNVMFENILIKYHMCINENMLCYISSENYNDMYKIVYDSCKNNTVTNIVICELIHNKTALIDYFMDENNISETNPTIHTSYSSLFTLCFLLALVLVWLKCCK